MQRIGGDPSLDFVNTAGGRAPAARAGYRVLRDRLRGYPELVAFAAETGLVSSGAARRLLRRAAVRPGEARAVLERVLAFREALYRTLRELMHDRRPPAPDLRRLNREIAASRSREELEATGLRARVALARRRPRARRTAPACRGRRRGPAHLARARAGRPLLRPRVRLAVRRQEPQPQPAVVRYEGLRQRREGAPLPRAAWPAGCRRTLASC